MQRLNIRNVKLGDDGFAAIASCVINNEVMFIGNEDNTEITTNGVRAIAQGILKSKKPVSYE